MLIMSTWQNLFVRLNESDDNVIDLIQIIITIEINMFI